MPELRIESGSVVVLRLFDVAYGIDLRRAEAIRPGDAPAAPEEDYLITTVRRFDRPIAPNEVLNTLDLPALLSRDRHRCPKRRCGSCSATSSATTRTTSPSSPGTTPPARARRR